jgi:hypothetical protein
MKGGWCKRGVGGCGAADVFAVVEEILESAVAVVEVARCRR